MKRLLTTTALALTLATGAYAANHTAFTYADGRVAGEPVYGDALTYDDAYVVDGYEPYTDPVTADDLDDAELYSTISGEDIGEIDDVIVQNGQVVAYVLEVGGFLGLGEAEVTVAADQVRIFRDTGGLNEVRAYISATEEQLEGYPRYEYEVSATNMDDSVMVGGDAAATSAAFMRRDGTAVREPAFGDAFEVDNNYVVDGYERYEGTYTDFLTEAAVEEAPLYSAVTGEEIGEVEDALEENGVLSALVLDIGGFLGMGEHTITVAPDQVMYMRDPGLLSDVRVYINATEEQLKAYPSYNADL